VFGGEVANFAERGLGENCPNQPKTQGFCPWDRIIIHQNKAKLAKTI